ncbi:MAG: hypothetical protein JW860_11605 [Sedimentisphaerales bacterium]|nr:hypothetical protein [Sedimentisphaerales bacterium]
MIAPEHKDKQKEKGVGYFRIVFWLYLGNALSWSLGVAVLELWYQEPCFIYILPFILLFLMLAFSDGETVCEWKGKIKTKLIKGELRRVDLITTGFFNGLLAVIVCVSLVVTARKLNTAYPQNENQLSLVLDFLGFLFMVASLILFFALPSLGLWILAGRPRADEEYLLKHGTLKDIIRRPLVLIFYGLLSILIIFVLYILALSEPSDTKASTPFNLNPTQNQILISFILSCWLYLVALFYLLLLNTTNIRRLVLKSGASLDRLRPTVKRQAMFFLFSGNVVFAMCFLIFYNCFTDIFLFLAAALSVLIVKNKGLAVRVGGYIASGYALIVHYTIELRPPAVCVIFFIYGLAGMSIAWLSYTLKQDIFDIYMNLKKKKEAVEDRGDG